MNPINSYDTIIIGAGAAGLYCAIKASQRGRRVMVLESSNKAGKKILMSGGGRCNFTNLHTTPENFLSANPHFFKSALSRHTQWDFIELVEHYGIEYHEKYQGQLFCNGSSKEILAMLLDLCDKHSVTIRTQCPATRVERASDFVVTTRLGELSAATVVVASGGLSVPSLGGTGVGYEIARQFGLEVLPTSAGLVPFTLSGELKELASRLSGLSLPVAVATGNMSFGDDLLFTHRGLSGPAVLQLSNYWHDGQPVDIDLLPEERAEEWIRQLAERQPASLMRNALAKRLPKKLVAELQGLFWHEEAESTLAQWPKRRLREVGETLGRWQLEPAGTEGYRTAEVTRGGVDTRGLSSRTMEARNCPGLFFIGEVVDVTGHLGGFNFQWAWSSAAAAGEAL